MELKTPCAFQGFSPAEEQNVFPGPHWSRGVILGGSSPGLLLSSTNISLTLFLKCSLHFLFQIFYFQFRFQSQSQTCWIQVPGVKPFSPQAEQIRHLQTLLVGNFFSFLIWEHFRVQAWFCSVVSISKRPFHSIPSCKSMENGSLAEDWTCAVPCPSKLWVVDFGFILVNPEHPQEKETNLARTTFAPSFHIFCLPGFHVCCCCKHQINQLH